MKDIPGAILFIVLSLPFALLPSGLWAGEMLGLLVFRLWKKRRLIAVKNIEGAAQRGAIVLERPASSVIRENFKNMGRSLSEVIKLYWGLGGKILSGVKIEGVENFQRAKEKGRGVLLITGHCGNWELLSLAFSLYVEPVGGVARPLDNRLLNGILERTRRRYGNRVIYKKGALKNILSTLRAGGAVGVLMDQSVVPDEGVLVDFLGAPAWTARMPAALAKKTGAAVVPAFIRRKGKGHLMTIHPEVELSGDDAADTARLSGFIEDYIRENPSEWLWIHRRWKRT